MTYATMQQNKPSAAQPSTNSPRSKPSSKKNDTSSTNTTTSTCPSLTIYTGMTPTSSMAVTHLIPSSRLELPNQSSLLRIPIAPSAINTPTMSQMDIAQTLNTPVAMVTSSTVPPTTTAPMFSKATSVTKEP